MDINKYRLFVDVADTLNLTKTGERMGYTQPGVSNVIKGLEEEFGFALINRKNKKTISLTPEAEKILPAIREILKANETLEQNVNLIKGIKTGHLAIASFASITGVILPRIIRYFQLNYPGIELELLEGGTDEIISWVETGRAEIGLVSRHNPEDTNWISLCEDPMLAVFSEYDAKNIGEKFELSDIPNRYFILTAEGVDYDTHEILKKEQVTPVVSFSSKDDNTIISMVQNELGMSILPKLSLTNLPKGVVIKETVPQYKRELGIISKKGATLSPAAMRFVEIMQGAIKDIYN